MLVLKRKVGESVTIGNDITITLKKSNSGGAHFAVDAPRSVAVMRTELIHATRNEDKTMSNTTNTQARLEGSDTWHDYGSVAMYEAARLEAIHAARGAPEYEWLIEVRRENDDVIPAIIVRVKTFISTEIIDPRRGSD